MIKIDDLFRNSEHQKTVEVRPELWEKLERRLDDDLPPGRSWMRWLVAASLLAIFTFTTLLYLSNDTYQVEDMNVLDQPRFSKEEIAGLEKVYWVPRRIFVNPKVG